MTPGLSTSSQALALDCLPQGKTTAEAFGLWGVAGTMDDGNDWLMMVN